MREDMNPNTCTNCGETTEDGHQFNGICLRVAPEDVPAFERTDRADWEGS